MTLLILCIIALINETLYRFKIVGVFNNDIAEPVNNDFSYFTLDYTSPFTAERENSCRLSVFTHCLFTHVLTNLIWVYCLIGNTYF